MKTVMIVDDSRVMRAIVKNIFEQIKIPAIFIEAEDGKKALNLLESNDVNLILLDWNMPHLSGIDFLKQVRAIEKYKKTPIIMVTGEASRPNVVEAVRSGITAYVTKPIKAENFIDKLSSITF